MIQKNKIGVLGCGWLGIPLSKSLIKNNNIVFGTTTDKFKLSVLSRHKIKPFLINVTEKEILGEWNNFFKKLDILVINIPPKENMNYNFIIKTLFEKIKGSNQIKLIFVSSTSVYGNMQGDVNSNTIPKPESKRGSTIIEAENILKRNPQTTILRLGGLIGPDRNPARILSSKKIVHNPNNPINLIHIDDCIGIIESIIKKEKWGKIYLGVCPHHPTKESYYNAQCIKLGISKINFSESPISSNKKINDNNIIEDLKYNYKKPSL